MVAPHGRVAQLGEHLLCKQGVAGSIPVTSTKQFNNLTKSVGFHSMNVHTNVHTGPGRNRDAPKHSLHRVDPSSACLS